MGGRERNAPHFLQWCCIQFQSLLSSKRHYSIYREVQLDFTPEIEVHVSIMLFQRCNIKKEGDLSNIMRYINFRSNIQLDHRVRRLDSESTNFPTCRNLSHLKQIDYVAFFLLPLLHSSSCRIQCCSLHCSRQSLLSSPRPSTSLNMGRIKLCCNSNNGAIFRVPIVQQNFWL